MPLILVLSACWLFLLGWLLVTHRQYGEFKKDRDYFISRGKPRSLSGKRSRRQKIPITIQPPEGSNLEPRVEYFTPTTLESEKAAHAEEVRLNGLGIAIPRKLTWGWAVLMALTLLILFVRYSQIY